MKKNWQRYIQRIIVSLIGLTAIGLLVGSLSWTLVIGLAAYLTWTLTQAIKLHQWLYSPNTKSTPPESHGLWGDLFDGIHTLQKDHNNVQDRLRTMINRVQESANALNDAVIMTDARGAMEWWNKSATTYLGFMPRSDHGQPIYNLIRTPAFKSYFEQKNYDDPIELSSPAKPHIMLRFRITLFGEDDRLIIAQDITRVHNLEQMRKDFVSNVSHELRTPLTVISGYLETLSGNADTLPPIWSRALNTMSQQAGRMELLISDLLLLAKFETIDQSQARQAVNINRLLKSIKSDALVLSGNQAHNIHLTTNTDSLLMGDENQLRSAFSNIIFNAVKYTPAEGNIDIHWWSDDKGVHLSVKDTGVGFDPIHIPRLTERFYRADPSRHKDTGGSGLGLAIVKHVLRNHDGELEVKSSLGLGSEFICHFPSRSH
ncbi:phosphate regulon sensor histidine kinase PhoR [Alkalimarinus alittae]|uniref:Phosphate regulon sensor protein PhoR n=1 Tax=Alkalimarinus alittae TaxID=2961619 RepID=A0ABY6N0S6_9ALTE|nr:phosphate regulon sensor histidine kinase PhoR [Alkalimarinus alittae]UZE95684.1 phosphate regulon sensor histidine kinase PhoR [Alkalimarinus alittae]